jgi:hypothetical protein
MEKIVIGSQLFLLLFHQCTTLVDLYPFNNVRSYSLKERAIECLVNGSIMLLPALGFIFHIQWLMITSLLVYPVLLAGEFMSWWRHYFFGATECWQKMYDRLFKETIIVLPPIKNHPVPNLEHTILHGLTLITTILTYIYYFTH